MAISAQDVKALRDATGLGMADCKKALVEADGDFDKAAEIARAKFGAKMAGRSDRESAEGRVAIATNADGSKGAIVQINTETDFTAKNDVFIAMADKVASLALDMPAGDIAVSDAMEATMNEVRLTTGENVQFGDGVVYEPGKPGCVGGYGHFTGKVGVLIELDTESETPSDELIKDLCMHVSAIVPEALGVNEEDIPADVVEAEKKHALKEAMDSGKPEEIAEKMVIGKMRKYLDSVVLLRQPFVKDDKQQIQDILPKGVTIKA
ncbi:MAG: translation elongation factor Ts, partial [Phycisphaeraceae bacterium]